MGLFEDLKKKIMGVKDKTVESVQDDNVADDKDVVVAEEDFGPAVHLTQDPFMHSYEQMAAAVEKEFGVKIPVAACAFLSGYTLGDLKFSTVHGKGKNEYLALFKASKKEDLLEDYPSKKSVSILCGPNQTTVNVANFDRKNEFARFLNFSMEESKTDSTVIRPTKVTETTVFAEAGVTYDEILAMPANACDASKYCAEHNMPYSFNNTELKDGVLESTIESFGANGKALRQERNYADPAKAFATITRMGQFINGGNNLPEIISANINELCMD